MGYAPRLNLSQLGLVLATVLNESRTEFYRKLGFTKLDTRLDVMTMHLKLEHLVAAIKRTHQPH